MGPAFPLNWQRLQSASTISPITEAPAVAASRRGGFSAVWFASAITVLFTLVASITAVFHEPWPDEAQAWLMSRDLGFWRLMSHQVRYEGTPGLWHAMLWAMAHLGLPYASMTVLSIALSAAGAWLLARYAPLPWWLRAGIPFTFYLLFQFAVVARSYALEPPLLFGALWLIREHPRRRGWLALVLGLLANSNLFGLFLSAALIPSALPCVNGRMRFQGYKTVRAAVPQLFRPALIYVAFVLCALAVAWPPRDVGFVTHVRLSNILHISSDPKAPPPQSDADDPEPEPKPRSEARKLADDVTFIAHTAGDRVTGVFFLAALVWLIIARRQFAAILPPLAVFAAFRLVLVLPHHYGLMFLALLASAWLAWPAGRLTGARRSWPAIACAASLAILCAEQLVWTARAIDYDIHYPYDGSKAAAAYLKAHFAGARIFGYDYSSVAVAPYFTHGPFANQPSTYWDWSYNNHVDHELGRLTTDHPDAVILSWRTAPDTPNLRRHGAMSTKVRDKEKALRDAGYTPIRLFTGTQVNGRGSIETTYLQLFVPAGRNTQLRPGG